MGEKLHECNSDCLGNGDIKSADEAEAMHKTYGVDGVMIGRGVFSNPWVFEKEEKEHTKEEYLELLLKHMHLFVETWGKTKNFDILKKFFKMYVNNFPNASDLRAKLMACKTPKEVESVVVSYL
jgi:tRNA-dihydrouridine synthase